MEKSKKKSKEEGGDKPGKNEMKSSKFFKNLQNVVSEDAKKKEHKKQMKLEGKTVSGKKYMPLTNTNNLPSKRFKL